mgnify:CR=1 FL=1
MVIVKSTIRSILTLILILVLTAIIVIVYTTYSKSKETQAFYTSTYIKAFEQTSITSDLIEAVLDNRNNITSQETLSELNDIQNSLNMTAEDFNLIAQGFSSNKPNTDRNFMPDLIQLYSDEISDLQSQLLKNNSEESFNDVKDVLFIRLAFMNSDMQKIINVDSPQLASYTYDQMKQVWSKMVNTLEYVEVTKVYKLRHSSLFIKGYFFPYKKN